MRERREEGMKWEYCKIVDPVRMRVEGTSEKIESPRLILLGSSREETKTQTIENVGHELAKLGLDGWELVSHTVSWAIVAGKSPMVSPALEHYYFKRPLAAEES